MKIKRLLRKNIRQFKPYSSARDEFSGKQGIFLDANENSFGSVSKVKANRYPDPAQSELKKKIADLKQIPEQHIFLGNGSDEAIDLLFRAFCRPGKDACLILPPTYGMYSVCANLNDTSVIEVPLTKDFEIDLNQVQKKLTSKTKLSFICSPNNPSANLMEPSAIKKILKKSQGLVVVDEAYIDFSDHPGWLPVLDTFKNLVILQTFSKAWGMAGLRLGMAFAHPEIIQVLNKIKYPYNIGILTQQAASEAVENVDKMRGYAKEIIAQRKILLDRLKTLSIVKRIYPSEANFILVQFKNARILYNKLLDNGVIVRDRSRMIHCENCLRITVGTAEENIKLLKVLESLS